MSINSFTGRYHFLSNFYHHFIIWHNMQFPTNEHAFQSAKTLSLQEKLTVSRCMSPGIAKKLGGPKEKGGIVTLREDWDSIKLGIMLELLRIKFADPALTAMLLATGDEVLIEGNMWNDTYWGVCHGSGANHLGLLLMQVRQEIRAKRSTKTMSIGA